MKKKNYYFEMKFTMESILEMKKKLLFFNRNLNINTKII